MNKYKSSLGDLANPSKFQLPLVIDGQIDEILFSQLRTMAIIRKAEQQLALGRKEGLIGGPVHLSVGQEAIAVGVSSNLLLYNTFSKLISPLSIRTLDLSTLLGATALVFDPSTQT